MSHSSFPTRQLGKDGPLVSAMGFGTMGMSYPTYGTTPDLEGQFALLDRAHEIGARFWDSADLYGDGEEIIGKWFRRTGKRGDIFLATKFGILRTKSFDTDSSAEYCRKACAESLRKLGVEYIDLYYLHHANPKTPIEETMRALAELKAQGKIKYIGLSAVSATTLRRAVKIAPVAAVQVDYSPFVLRAESASTNFLATCRELGVAVVAAMPLGRGLLTGTFASGELSSGTAAAEAADTRLKMMPRFMDGNRQHNEEVVRGFAAFAEEKGCSVAQLALAWLLGQGRDVIPIPGTKKIGYLEENWAALGIELSEEEEGRIRRFVEGADIAGGNIPEAFRHYEYVDTVEEVGQQPSE